MTSDTSQEFPSQAQAPPLAGDRWLERPPLSSRPPPFSGSRRLAAVVRVNWHFLVISSECWFLIGKSHSWQAQSRYLTPMT